MVNGYEYFYDSSGISKSKKFNKAAKAFSTIDLSNDSIYKHCDRCKYWVSVSNIHCTKCKECTSKNGMTYQHCSMCRYVKPTFKHCETCGRCCQEKGHVCCTLVESQSCYNCNEKGHKQSVCPKKGGGVKKRRKSTK